MDGVDLFISYRSADVAWAEWIAWTLDEAGYSIILQSWDFHAGENLILKMNDASRSARRMLLVLSPSYFTSAYTEAEWTAKLAEGLAQGSDTLLPVRVAQCEIGGLLGARIWVDLVGLDEEAARARLLAAAAAERRRPDVAPCFPGAPARAQGPVPGYPGAPPDIWHILHPRNPDFTGRGALLEDVRALLDESYPVALHGTGGVGKTQIAVEFAYRYASEYDLVWWLRAEEPALLVADCLELVAALGLGEVEPGHAVERVRRALEGRARWLLIYDNAEGPEPLHTALPTQGGHCLITTRCPDWQGLAQTQSVDVWERHESVAFLERVTGQTDGATALAELLGDLPLALAQAGAYVRASGQSLMAYTDLFVTRRAELWGREMPPPGYREPVAVTWTLSIERAASASPAARDLLSLCAVLAPDGIPRALIVEHAGSLPEPLAEVARDPLALDDAVAALRRYSLLEVGRETWAVHRLVQTVVRDALDDEEHTRWAAAAVAWLARAFPGDTQTNISAWANCARLLPHALVAIEHAERLGMNRTKTEATAVSGLLNSMGLYLQNTLAQYVLARWCYERALAIVEAVYGPDHAAVATEVNNLGGVLQALGDLAGARGHFERAVAIDNAVYGPDHPEVATDVNNLGGVLQELGDLAGARDHFERALAIYEAGYGPDHPTVAGAVNNLGSVLRELGDLAGARVHFKRALAIDEAAYGPDHPEVATDVNNLGGVLQALGDLAGARAHFERAVAIVEAVYGPDHPTVAGAANNLGSVLHELGDLAGARAHGERALAIFARRLGAEHPNTVLVRHNLATLDAKLGQDA